MSDEPVMFVRHSGGGFLGDGWSQGWLFGEVDGQPRIGIHYQDVTYVSLENVFEWMNKDDTRRQRSLHTMLGLRDEV